MLENRITKQNKRTFTNTDFAKVKENLKMPTGRELIMVTRENSIFLGSNGKEKFNLYELLNNYCISCICKAMLKQKWFIRRRLTDAAVEENYGPPSSVARAQSISKSAWKAVLRQSETLQMSFKGQLSM